MIKQLRNKLYNEALDKFGIVNQHGMLMEECAELIRATNKLNRQALLSQEQNNERSEFHENFKNFVEEIADVEIMIEQMKVCYSIGNLVEIKKDNKLERLKKLVRGR